MVRTAGSWMLLAGLGVAGFAWPLGCRPDEGQGTPTPHGEAAVADVLAAVGPQVVIPTLTRFRDQTATLREATEAWRVAAADGEAEAEKQAAREAWRAAMLTWQQAELMQMGPAGSSLTAVGGEDLRDAIYSWPTTNPCRVDQETVEAEWDNPNWFTVNLVNSYGLAALERLLYGGASNACPAQVDINANGTWAALGPAGVEQHRAAYAVALTDDLIRRADRLLDAWGSGSFALDTTVFDSEQDALNAVYHALFYIEKMGKDRKVAIPAGLGTCSVDCTSQVELRASGLSTEALIANLDGYELLFTGGEGPGMSDLLHTVGHGDLAELFTERIAAARQQLTDLGLPLDEAIEADPQLGIDVHTAMKGVTDLVKVDLSTVLALEIPAEAAGDND